MNYIFTSHDKLCSEVRRLISGSEKRPYIIGIDGRCASGKTTLAERLSESLCSTVFHTDDYFLRPEQRTEERFSEVGGNFDRERFISEIIEPIEKDEKIKYRRFSCSDMSLCPPTEVETTDVIIIEGAYSMHPEICGRGIYDLRIFSDVERDEQTRRIAERNGEEMLDAFLQRWIPMEERYFAEYKIAESCDIVYTVSVRGEAAKKNFLDGYNCAQAVLLAFSDLTGLDEGTLAMLSSPFGGGMGRMREVCGSVSGMLMTEGLLCGYQLPDDMDGKKRVYAETRDLADRFKAENGSIICRELLEGVKKTDGGIPEERTVEYYKKRPCAELVKCAAEILEGHLREQSII